MPPDVAQAPMVTRILDCRRTSLMRSASCAVVIEPSTRLRSKGPSWTALEASRKLAISTALASVKSSSSQSRSESWHPAQEANFQTARRGRMRSAMSHLPYGKDLFDPFIGHHWAVLANEIGPELAAPAQSRGTLHVAFHREKDFAGGNTHVA